MISKSLLLKILGTARTKSAGKPLDKITSLFEGDGRYRSQMRSCRLFQVSEDLFQVKLHNNTITYLDFSGPELIVTLHSVADWATVTTAERLTSILGEPVYRHNNKLRMAIGNATEEHTTGTILRDGMKLVYRRGRWYLLNPQLAVDDREQVNRDRARPVLHFLKQIEKLAMPVCRMGAVTHTELSNLYQNHELVFQQVHLDTPPDMQLAMYVLNYGRNQKMRWRVMSAQGEIEPNNAVEYLKCGLAHLKNLLYTKYTVHDPRFADYPSTFEHHDAVGHPLPMV